MASYGNFVYGPLLGAAAVAGGLYYVTGDARVLLAAGAVSLLVLEASRRRVINQIAAQAEADKAMAALREAGPVVAQVPDSLLPAETPAIVRTTQLVTPSMCGPMPDNDIIHGITNVSAWVNKETGERVAVGAMVPCSTNGQWQAQV